jgi:GT2 family glycosyltransferase
MKSISVIVPVRNGADDLAALLDSLDRQTLVPDSWEIVIGDDGSTDDIAAAVGGRPHVRVVSGPAANAYAARNRAADAAVGSIFAFVDADCRPLPDWLEAGTRALEQGADLAGGRIDWRIDGRRTVWSLLDIDTFVDPELVVAQGAALTGNLFVRRSTFQEVGGFDSSLPSHGDYDFAQRCVSAGARLVFADDAAVTHPTYNAGRPFLRKVVEANMTYAAREARAGRIPEGLRLREWVPLLQTVRSRRRFGKSLLLNRRHLTECGIHPMPIEDALALPLIYVVLPYVSVISQLTTYLRVKRGRASETSYGAPPQQPST